MLFLEMMIIAIYAHCLDFVFYVHSFDDMLFLTDVVESTNTPIIEINTLPGQSELGDDNQEKEII